MYTGVLPPVGGWMGGVEIGEVGPTEISHPFIPSPPPPSGPIQPPHTHTHTHTPSRRPDTPAEHGGSISAPGRCYPAAGRDARWKGGEGGEGKGRDRAGFVGRGGGGGHSGGARQDRGASPPHWSMEVATRQAALTGSWFPPSTAQQGGKFGGVGQSQTALPYPPHPYPQDNCLHSRGLARTGVVCRLPCHG